MKTLSKTLVLTAFSAIVIFAQGQGPQPPDPAAMIKNHVQRLTNRFNLTPDQASQANSIFTSAQSVISPAQTTLNKDRQELRTAVKNNETATIDRLSNEIGLLTGQITAAQSKAEAAFYGILTTEQKAVADRTGGRGFGMGPGMGIGMGMGQGPGPGPGMMGPRGGRRGGQQ